jgi:pimeloyl-ACP methyl ester carboxylesterase
VPTALTSKVVWGNRDSLARRNELREVMRRVDPEIVSLRNREALRVDRREGSRIGPRALVMRGRRDRLIGPRSAGTLDEVLLDVERVEFDAPHFLFQTEPDATAECIVDFALRRAFSTGAGRVARRASYSGS